MLFVSDIKITSPSEFQTPLQEKTYQTLQALHIPFQRVETDEAITMDDCIQINQALDMKMVKTLFLCNRQKTDFYLFITSGDKPFHTKIFSRALNISRVSFTPADLMEDILGTKIGAATVFSALTDQDHILKIVFDQDVANDEWYGCSDGTTTGYMKIKTSYMLNQILPFINHVPIIISLDKEILS